MQELLEAKDKDELATATFSDGDEVTKALKKAGISVVRGYGKETIVITKADMKAANKAIKDIKGAGKFKVD
jgi:lysophospholipid acyltransferase (LPLAT)-like uncharacterized protein